MDKSLDDIAELAESIGNRFLFRGRVDLEKIVKTKRISFIKNNYGNHFLGQLVHYSKKFYIILNTDLLEHSESGRIRFTIAHELGHFFISAHKAQLSKGVSLSFKGDLNEQECKKIEIAANHFAANLLMPKAHFTRLAHKLELGLAGIFILKAKYDTSIESTTKHYVNLNISASVMIKWKADHTFHYSWCSKLFREVTGIKEYPLPIRFDSRYISEQVAVIDSNALEYNETVTELSRWFSTVLQGSSEDILGLEQTVKLGDFGGITLLTFRKVD